MTTQVKQAHQDLVKFQGVQIQTFTKGDQHLIAIKPLCETFGIQWQAQHRKLQRSELFSSTISVTDTVGADGKNRQMTCLPLEVFPMWLARINTSRVENPYAAKLILAFQKEATQVLYEHFLGTPEEREEEVRQLENKLGRQAGRSIEQMQQKLFGRAHGSEYYESQWIWRLHSEFEQFSTIGEKVDMSTDQISRRFRKYEWYLDATDDERQLADGYGADDATIDDLYKLLSDRFPAKEDLVDALLGDWKQVRDIAKAAEVAYERS